jgi:hypothetical protein
MQTVSAHRELRTVPEFVWGAEEDLKYQNNESEDEQINPEHPDYESGELTTTLWRLVGGF